MSRIPASQGRILEAIQEHHPHKFLSPEILEAPRGVLIHHYKVDESGAMNWVNLIVATGHNNLALNRSVAQVAEHFIDGAGFKEGMFNSRVRALTVDTLTGMTVAGGDGQSGNTGTALPAPLVVALSFPGGVGTSGIPVTFSVTSGTATLSLPATTTDALGHAGVGITLGNSPGPIVVTASTAGASPVQFHFTAISTVPLPTIGAAGLEGAGGSTPPVTEISPGGFATLFGSNFAPAGTFQQASSGAWPTQLAGVCVMVNGTPAFVTFVSASQINFQAPTIPVNTTVTVQVIGNCGTDNATQSAPFSASTLAATPEFLYWVSTANGQNPVVAVNAVTGAYIGAVGLISGPTFVPAKPGDVLTVYGVSFGPTSPVAVPGTPSTTSAQSVYPALVTLGAVSFPSATYYAGVSPGTAGLYQLNIQVPANLPDGDYSIVLTLGTFSTPVGGYITVKN